METASSFNLLKNLYFFIELNFKQIYFLCENDDQKNQLRQDFLTARDNFAEAGNRDFHENNPLLKIVILQLRNYQKKLEQIPCSPRNFHEVLNAITSTVHLGSTLVTLGRKEWVETAVSSPASRSNAAGFPCEG